MSALSPVIDSFSPWLPAFAMIFGTNAAVALAHRPLGRVRWLLATFVLLTPLSFPSPAAIGDRWGAYATIATTMAIVSAARLPALDHLLITRARGRDQLFFWMMVPVARFWPASVEKRRDNRKRVLRLLLSAALKWLSWQPFGYLVTEIPGDEVHWLFRSAVVMLYFVLNITAAADALSALCLLLGCEVDVLFDAPLLSRSPRDFWSTRWNKFINRFALKHVALPLGRKWPRAGVILAVFATSGAFHEYFAWGVGADGARYGLMTIFFVIQGVVVWLGTRLPVPPHPAVLGTGLTFAWMMLTAPLFFGAIELALAGFGYPPDWSPSAGLLN